MEIVGEKINTTRKSVRKAVEERDTKFIQDLARKQFEAGATYLDVNSGLALYPEEEAEDFAWLVITSYSIHLYEVIRRRQRRLQIYKLQYHFLAPFCLTKRCIRGY